MIEDKGNKVLYLVFIIGIGSVLPFNILLNASSFFSHKFSRENGTELDHKDGIEASFSTFVVSYLGVASTLPNVFCQIYNLFSKTSSGSVQKKLLICIIIQIICFVFVIGSCFIDAIEHPYVYFLSLLTLTSAVNSAGGLFQNLSYLLAANLPMKYTNSVVTGSNSGGILSAIAMIVSIGVSNNQLYSLVFFFIVAIIFIAMQILVSKLLFKNKYYLKKQAENNAQDYSVFDEKSIQVSNGNEIKKDFKLIKTVFGECWPQFLTIFLTFYVTLIIFPAIQTGVKPVNENFLSIPYFIALFTFFNFNFFATIGNLVTFWDKFPKVSRERIWIFVILRFLLIPFFLFCNYKPDKITRTFPVLFDSDTVYIIGGSFLGFTSGYFSSLELMYVPKSVSKPEYAETAAKMAGVSLILGVFSGVSSSFLMPVLIS